MHYLRVGKKGGRNKKKGKGEIKYGTKNTYSIHEFILLIMHFWNTCVYAKKKK